MALSASNASCADTPIRDAPRRFSFIFLRDGRDWGDHGRKLEGHQDRSWQGNVAGGVMGRDHERWQGTLAASQCDRGLSINYAAQLLVVIKACGP